jgi:Ca-activated chloride channel family protein
MLPAMKRGLPLVRVCAAIAVVALGCKKEQKASPGPDPDRDGSAVAPVPGKPPVELEISYGSEKKKWLEAEITKFNARNTTIADGRPVHVTGRALGSGEAMQEIMTGARKPHVFSPASGAYVELLNHAWQSQAGHNKPIAPTGEPLVLSPIVIAMWKPMAEALGWPGKSIGWAEILEVSRNSKGWAAYGRPEWGQFKLGHTHPEYSNSGLLAVLAAAYAGAGKTRDLSATDLDDKKLRQFLSAVEESVVHYGKSTGFFGDKMFERGPTYLSAAILYENLVIDSYARTPAPPMPVVAIYPTEGTFWSDHPYAVLDADWVGDAEREAAKLFLAALKGQDAQLAALASGFRPADPKLAIGAPIDAAHGVDPKQPQTLLDVPDGAALDKLVATWRTVKKTSDVALVFDKSGSMVGEPLAQAKAGAKAFLATLDQRDRVTLIFFDSVVYPPFGPVEVGAKRAELEGRIDGVIADGGTALYDAIDAAAGAIVKQGKSSKRIHALVVLTDGMDDGSKLTLEALQSSLAREGSHVNLFTVAYGAQAEERVLSSLAEAARGSFAKGDVKTITEVFRDMASFF